MSEPSECNEPVPPKPEPANQEVARELLLGIIGFTAASYITGIVILMSKDDELRLQVLHTTLQVVQHVARLFGGWALHLESAYNKYVDTLH
jgi:hypothetical protein